MLPKIYASVSSPSSIEQLKQDPFTVLFLAALKQRPVTTFGERLAFLSDFLEGLEQADHTMEDVLNGHNWMTIGCLFTAMATVGVSMTIPMLAPVAMASVIGALGAGGSQVQHSATHKPIHDRLKRTYQMLRERPLEDWAALWEVAGRDELFASAIVTAEWNFQKGISFATTQAINRIGHELGTHPSIVAERFKQVRSGFTQNAIPPRPADIPPDAPRYLPEHSPVRIQTQLGEPSAINVTAQSVPPGNDPVSVLSRSYQAVDQIGLPDDLAALAVQKPYNTLIFGQSEAGKDITLYNIMKRNRAAHSAYFLGIDGKNHPGERALWSNEIYDDTLHFSMLDDPATYHAALLAALKFAVQQPMSFVAFSEINGVRNAYANSGMKTEWQLIVRYVAYFALQGNANRHFLYGTVQALTLDELGLGSGDRGNIYFLAIANSTQFGFIESVGASVKVFPKALTNQAVFQSAVSRSTATQHLKNHAILKGIAYFHSAIGEWRPMPRLENPGSERGEDLRQAEPQIQAPPREVSPIQDEPIQDEQNNQSSKNKEDKNNIQKPNLSRTELVFAIGELGEWIDKNPGLSFSQQYANYSAARKGFSRPQFRYLLTQIENLDS